MILLAGNGIPMFRMSESGDVAVETVVISGPGPVPGISYPLHVVYCGGEWAICCAKFMLIIKLVFVFYAIGLGHLG